MLLRSSYISNGNCVACAITIGANGNDEIVGVTNYSIICESAGYGIPTGCIIR